MTHEKTTNNGRGVPEGAAGTRNALGEEALARTGETAMTAVAEKAKALVQARITQAIMRPRKLSVVRERILEDCERPSFAKVAIYSRPQGQKKVENPDGSESWVPNIIEGLSIRFVEAAVQAMGNCEPVTALLYEDEHKKIVRCEISDLERNIAWGQEITIEKTVERSRLKKGQIPLGKRKNSYGDDVFILQATDDEMRLKENRLYSMTLRTLGLRIVPGDIIDEAKERIYETRAKTEAAELAGIVADPTKARKDLLDRLARIGIRAADVVEYFGGRDLEAATPDMIREIRAVGASVHNGDIAWRDALAGSPYRQQTEEVAEDDAAKKARKHIQSVLEKGKAAKPKAQNEGEKTDPKPTVVEAASSAQPTQPQEREPGSDG